MCQYVPTELSGILSRVCSVIQQHNRKRHFVTDFNHSNLKPYNNQYMKNLHKIHSGNTALPSFTPSDIQTGPHITSNFHIKHFSHTTILIAHKYLQTIPGFKTKCQTYGNLHRSTLKPLSR